MTLVIRRWSVAAVLACGVVVAQPAQAGLLQIESPSTMATAQNAWGARGPAEVPVRDAAAALPARLAPMAPCDNCGTEMAATTTPQRGSTRSVNVAILLLGSLWLTLMIRRVQQRLGSEDLNGGARPHAAGGH